MSGNWAGGQPFLLRLPGDPVAVYIGSYVYDATRLRCWLLCEVSSSPVQHREITTARAGDFAVTTMVVTDTSRPKFL
jgi:hypothetical protein